MPTPTADPLLILRSQVEAATPTPWTLDLDTLVNRTLEDARWDGNDEGKPSWTVAEVYAPANAAFIITAVNIARFLASDAVETLARFLCVYNSCNPDDEFEGSPMWTNWEDEVRAILIEIARRGLSDDK